MASDEEEEAVALHYLDVALDDIDRKFESGEMDAFGANGAGLLKEVSRIRAAQTSIFLAQMTLEMSTAEVEPDQEQGEQTRPAGQRYREAFEEKEGEVKRLTEQLHAVTEMIGSVNARAQRPSARS